MALPYAPSSWHPPDGSTIIRSVANTFWAQHSVVQTDPVTDADLLQAGQMRSRTAGTPTWSTPRDHSYLASERAYFDLSAGTFSAGAQEVSFRTSSPDGYGPWSQTSFFSAVDVPATPAITSAASVNATPWTMTWTAAGQDAYQLRRLADAGGAPGAVLWTGPTVASTARQGSITHPLSPATEHQQVRVSLNGAWSEWASLQVTVDYTYPAIPTLTVRRNLIDEPPDWPAGTALVVTVDNPAGGATVLSNDVQRQQSRDGKRWTNERGVEFEWDTVASGLAVDGTYIDTSVAHRMAYRHRAAAFTADAQTRVGPARTYQELEAAYPTYQQLEAAFPTYHEISDLWVE